MQAPDDAKDHTAAHFYLARVYVLLGRKEEAQAEYREVIKLEPAFALAKRELAAVRGET
jgi:Tfp pilus assembly protein PilF